LGLCAPLFPCFLQLTDQYGCQAEVFDVV
jgi:hypothetical protein